MKIFGKPAAEYIRLQIPFLVLIAVVGLLRLGLSLAGVADPVVRWLSLTALLPIGTVYAAVRVHTTGFGGYRHLLPVVFFQTLTAQIIIIAGIAIAIITQRGNVFTRVENVLPAADPGGVGVGANWGHVGLHVFAIVFLSLVLWGLGSLVLLSVRRLKPVH